MMPVSLDDKYVAQGGRVFLNGSQALTRLPLMQAALDQRSGLKTGGFISGYRGSPLGGYDLALWKAAEHMKRAGVLFQPGVNEDLAATAILGTQQLEAHGETDYDGVFSIWYGKGPGVDRSGDALKHGALAGASRHGGVLALCGDDHGCRSSTTAHQSDHALIHFGMPILNPGNIQEYLEFGLLGFALSRFSGSWIGFKCITDTVDGSSSISLDSVRQQFNTPLDYVPPADGLDLRIGRVGIPAERLMFERLEAVKAFARANPVDRTIYPTTEKKLGIVTSGKAWLDVMEALALLGIDEAQALELGISVYKVGMVWPLEPQAIVQFARGAERLLVVEEKRPVIEEQLTNLLYPLAAAERPDISGKRDIEGRDLVPSFGELNPRMVARIIASQHPTLSARAFEPAHPDLKPGISAKAPPIATRKLERLPSFCAGCPHSTSTTVPEGSVARPGIGCHGMVQFVPGRRTESNLTHMGGEGATWMGEAPFSRRRHIFQNLGDGTYFHSGLLAIRATVAAGTSITYKILVNGAISMTGGQPIEGESFDGGITAPHIAWQVHAEGVQRIALVTEEFGRHDRALYPSITTLHHRDELATVQEEIREHKGTSVIIYEQACATERRRLRKRGQYPKSAKRLFINQDVCEGCGDCGIQSSCIALEPAETPFGRKRSINQSVCNQDLSCVKGMCPSFVSVYNADLRSIASENEAFDESVFAAIPEPELGETTAVSNILVAGIGGSGIVTLGAILGMAAHLEGRACNILDVTGAAQRNGAVTSHVRIASSATLELAPRIPEGSADILLAADLVVATGAHVLPVLAPGHTKAVYNSYLAPTADFAQDADLPFDIAGMERQISAHCAQQQTHAISATRLATLVLGNAVGANSVILGHAWQLGLIPLSRAAIERAIELNGVEVPMNLRAFRLGRLSATDPNAIEAMLAPDGGHGVARDEPLERVIDRHRERLTKYQDHRYADRYEKLVRKAEAAEHRIMGDTSKFTAAVARNFGKLLAYKDEYEVARLLTDQKFFDNLAQNFSGNYRIKYNLAPPLLSRRDPASGRLKKREFGAWIIPALKLLASLKRVRGTPFDIFGYTSHRRDERRLAQDYEAALEEAIASLAVTNLQDAAALAHLPDAVRGYDIVKEGGIKTMRSALADLRTRISSPHPNPATEAPGANRHAVQQHRQHEDIPA